MILARIEDFQKYFPSARMKPVLDFILSLGPDAPEGKTEIAGDLITASVSSYDTKPRTDARPESHIIHTDIQLVLSGREIIEYAPVSILGTPVERKDDMDVLFYERPEPLCTEIALTPGMFAVFFPEDGHMPQLQISGSPSRVKKAVIKLKKQALT